MDSSIPLHDIDEAHSHARVETFRNYNYVYARSILTVCFSTTVNSEATTYTSAVHIVGLMKLLRDGYCIEMLTGGHGRGFIEMLQDKGGAEWDAELLRIHYLFWVSKKSNSPAQAIY